MFAARGTPVDRRRFTPRQSSPVRCVTIAWRSSSIFEPFESSEAR